MEECVMWSFEYDTGTGRDESQWYADGDNSVSCY